MTTSKTVPDLKLLFNTIATRYDTANTLLSFGCNTLWLRALIRELLQESTPQAVLDLCCGTGAVTEQLVIDMKKKQLPLPTIDCVDFSENMLDKARERLSLQDIHPCFHIADACCLPFADGSFDTIAIAYGVRNIPHTEHVLSECYRLLQPHGKLFILELTTPKALPVRLIHAFYLKTFAPLIGWLVTRHKKPYHYLDHSIEHFSLPDLIMTLKRVGFSCRRPIALSYGIATVIQAEKK